MAACTATPMGFGCPRCLVNLLCRCIADAQPHPPAPQMLLKALERWWLCLFLAVRWQFAFSPWCKSFSLCGIFSVVRRVVFWAASSVQQWNSRCKCAGERHKTLQEPGRGTGQRGDPAQEGASRCSSPRVLDWIPHISPVPIAERWTLSVRSNFFPRTG